MQRTCGSCTRRPPASASTTRTCWKTCCRTALRLESLGGEPPSTRLRLEEDSHAPHPMACELHPTRRLPHLRATPHARQQVAARTCACTYQYSNTRAHVYICTYICVYLNIYIRTRAHVLIQTHGRLYTHTYAHDPKPRHFLIAGIPAIHGCRRCRVHQPGRR